MAPTTLASQGSTAQRFFDYPEPKEYQVNGSTKVADNNPVLSGYPLTMLSNV